MNPLDLDATGLLVWGACLHFIADWPLQSEWMAKKKVKVFHPAGYVHATIQGLCLAVVFGWAAIPLAIAHLLIDFRKPVVWWSKLVRQTQPGGRSYFQRFNTWQTAEEIPLYDMGNEVRIWTDQVFHIVCIAVAALLVTM